MLFNSYAFILFYLPVTIGFFFLAGRFSHRLAIAWMALASLAFYAWWNPPYVLLLFASILFNYAAGLLLIRCPEMARRRILTLAVLSDLALLGYFKYATFFVDTASLATGADWKIGAVVLPLGISFFTFTQIAFLVDTARGEVVEVDFLRYLLFVTYFPHLIAGPILHHKEMMPQFAQPQISRFSANRLSLGLALFTMGLAKKVFLADNVAGFASPVFDSAAHGASPALVEAWAAALAYTLQIYFDFSGYSDMAIGLGRMVGVHLPLNFHSPYKATSIIEFWRRWHMTLSRFLRDYLYVPLGGNRKGPRRRTVNLMVTMLLGGLWHGAGWSFVLWGALHGTYLVINHWWRRQTGDHPRGSAWQVAARSLTFLAVVVAWVPFRATSIQATLSMLGGMCGLHGVRAVKMASLYSQGDLWMAPPRPVNWGQGGAWIAGLLLIVWLLPNSQEIFSRYRCLGAEHPRPDRLAWQRLSWCWRRSPGWATLTALVLAAALAQFGQASEFIYFQF
jgi:D-alanyl-lipoteichoic acid acyltransferase DltB (MBOAT superfamily)